MERQLCHVEQRLAVDSSRITVIQELFHMEHLRIGVSNAVRFLVEHLTHNFQIRLQPFVLHGAHCLLVGGFFVLIPTKMQCSMKNNPQKLVGI